MLVSGVRFSVEKASERLKLLSIRYEDSYEVAALAQRSAPSVKGLITDLIIRPNIVSSVVSLSASIAQSSHSSEVLPPSRSLPVTVEFWRVWMDARSSKIHTAVLSTHVRKLNSGGSVTASSRSGTRTLFHRSALGSRSWICFETKSDHCGCFCRTTGGAKSKGVSGTIKTQVNATTKLKVLGMDWIGRHINVMLPGGKSTRPEEE